MKIIEVWSLDFEYRFGKVFYNHSNVCSLSMIRVLIVLFSYSYERICTMTSITLLLLVKHFYLWANLAEVPLGERERGISQIIILPLHIIRENEMACTSLPLLHEKGPTHDDDHMCVRFLWGPWSERVEVIEHQKQR